MTRSSWFWRYGLAVGSVAVALGLTLLLEHFGHGIFVAPFIGAVLIAAWFGGRGPGWLAVILSTLAVDYLWLPPFGALEISPQTIFFFAGFVVCAAAANWLSTWRRQVEASLQQARDELQARVEERTAELRKSEEQWRDVFENNPTMYFMLDAGGTIVSVNPFGAEQLGYSVEELAGRSVLDVFHAADRETVQSNIALCLKQLGQAKSWEIRKLRKDGTVLWVRETAKAVPREKQTIVLAACEDITERKQSEERLRRSEAFLAEGQRMSHTGTWGWTISSGKLVWSEEHFRIFGFDPEAAEPSFQLLLKTLHPEDRPRFERTLDQARRERSGFTSEFRIILPNGAVKHVRAVGRPVVKESGDIDEYIGTTVDITARKRGEEELRERANLLDLTHDTVFARDMRDVITFWNRGAEEQYGWTSEEAVGQVSHELTRTRFPAPLEEITAELTRVGRWEGELVHTRRDGTQVVVASRWALQLDDRGNPIAVLETNNDVTERKQAQAEREARRAAEIANQAKSEFLARMSHELRTPLNGILGYAQILRRDKTLSERQFNGLAVIQQSGEHLLTLINDILDLSRIEAGKLDLDLADIPLHTFLRVVADIIRVRAEQKRLSFVCDAGPDLPQRIRGDERRLRQVLLNLLANAVKFTDRGEVSLRVSFAPPARLRCEVRDTGVGISEDRREAIFQPFEQSGEMERRTGGAGLGLSISRQLVRLMGGDLHLESRVGRGSTFWFELETPVVASEIPDALPERVVTGYTGARRKVLVVDDVAENRALVRDMLGQIGFEVFEAANGNEALEQSRILRPDLILMDTVMPDMDGLEATRRLRQWAGFAQTPIIAISANASGRNEERSLAAGVNAFLPKPLDFDRLASGVGDLLELEWTYEQNGAASALRTSDQPLLAPPANEMETLHRLALLGNMRDIVQHATHLVELDGRYRAFAERLRALASGYQSKAILRFVEEHIDRTDAS